MFNENSIENRQMNQLEIFTEHKGLLFSIAYNMLGIVQDAEDILQEAYLKWSSVTLEEIKNHRAYLVKIVTNLSINYLDSARKKREEYVGLWLPEPLLKEQVTDSFKAVDLYYSLSIGMMVLLERLTPSERAVFLLKDVLSYEYAEIAEILSKTQDNCRKIFSRAKKNLGGREKRFQIDVQVHEKMLQKFLSAVSHGNTEELIGLLREDIELLADGGGKSFTFGKQKFSANRKPVVGANFVSRFILNVGDKISRYVPNVTNKVVYVNGLPSLVTYSNNIAYCIICLEIRENRIANIYLQTNPDKIRNM
jgi:RNA polymerase sigma-70 factor, ECF subfamily